MKKVVKSTLLALLFSSLVGCSFSINLSSKSSDETSINSEEVISSENIESILSEEFSSSEETSNEELLSSEEASVENEIVSSEEIVISSEEEISSVESSNELLSSEEISIDNEPKVIEIYASNDVHGRISENVYENEPGISKLATFLKERKAENEDGFVYINSGDYWQDTYESGYNKGKLLTECLDLMECETLSLGNHEFDWGVDVIRENMKYTNTTFLGANIYKYPNINEKVDFAEDYKIVERDGIRIGIIGAIGMDQITSITSSNWEDITFVDHVPVVKTVSDKLRTEEDCDIVILSIHADEEDAGGSELSRVSPLSHKKYVDAVFCAHSHQNETKYYNEIPFIQASDHGTHLSYVKFLVDGDNVTVDSVSTNKGYLRMNALESDEEIDALIDTYFDEDFINQKNKVHGRIEGFSYVSSKYAGRILAKATDELLKENEIDVDIVINNGARSSVDAGDMTSEKIFNMIPFTNKTLVAKNILGKEIIAECVDYSNPYYMDDPTLQIESNKYYTVACIDYVLLHKNTRRNYNYFPSYNPNNLIYIIDDYSNAIVEKYLQKHTSINGYDYNTNNYTCLG